MLPRAGLEPTSPACPGESTCSSQGSSGLLPAGVNNLLFTQPRAGGPGGSHIPGTAPLAPRPASLRLGISLHAFTRFKNIYSLNCFSSRASPDKTKRVVCVQSSARVCKAARSSRFKSMSTHTRYQTPTHAEIVLLKNNELPIVSRAMEQG